MDRTGYALGNLSPIIYFESCGGHVILAAYDEAKPEQARMMFEQRFKSQGYLWRETRNLSEVDALQRKLVEQEMREGQKRDGQDDFHRDRVFRATGERLRHQMQSSTCTPFERDFIMHYLAMREAKRDPYRQRWAEATNYLWAREMDSKAKVTDRMKGDLSL